MSKLRSQSNGGGGGTIETRPVRNSPAIRVAIADDHSVVREGLAAMIGRESDMKIVAEAKNGKEAVQQWLRHQPDVLLLDLRMPELDGVTAIQQIRAESPGARIVVLTTFDSDENIYRGISAGAKGFLLKDVPPEELLRCIRSVHGGESYFPSSIAAKLAEHVSGPELTERELAILQQVASGMSNKEIGRHFFISEGTVKSHLKNIFAKLNVLSRSEATAAAVRRGLVHL
ncbi:MAG: two component transcriptional regulator, LuxR family [Verrucomicrobia bacterium]|nr:two component transcriptional regulator, LuxR family [Verrucomicrobiota bacterium]